MTTTDTAEASIQFNIVKDYCVRLLNGAQEFLPIEEFEDKITEKFGGLWFDTGGHCYVVYIPVNRFYYLSVTQESIVLYPYLGEQPISAAACSNQDNGYENIAIIEYFTEKAKYKEPEQTDGFFKTLFLFFYDYWRIGKTIVCVGGFIYYAHQIQDVNVMIALMFYIGLLMAPEK